MSTYKVIQDVEAEDKLVGPLTLRQFIYAGISAICLYLSFLSLTKHVVFLLVFFLPIAAFSGFFAFPWGRDQPTEVWALAKLRFALKPRKRIWDQSGIKDLVTITVPKRIERNLTNGLSQTEVRSRLGALADTIDSRGWAVKNINVNMSSDTDAASFANSDRLVSAASLPQEVSNLDIRASDDILDEVANPVAQHFDSMITASATAHHQQLVAQMQQPSTGVQPPASQARSGSPNDYWFMQQQQSVPGQATFVDASMVVPGQTPQPTAPQAATPTAEEEALAEKLRHDNDSQTSAAYGHMKTLKTLEEQAEDARIQTVNTVQSSIIPTKAQVTPQDQAAIINLAQNDDLDVATLARQAHKQPDSDDGEVIISLR